MQHKPGVAVTRPRRTDVTTTGYIPLFKRPQLLQHTFFSTGKQSRTATILNWLAGQFLTNTLHCGRGHNAFDRIPEYKGKVTIDNIDYSQPLDTLSLFCSRGEDTEPGAEALSF